MDELEARPARGLSDHVDVPGRRRRDHPVVRVEVEVAAAGEVLEYVSRHVLTRRQRERGQLGQRVGVEHEQLGSGHTHADRHHAAAAVEGDRAAVAPHRLRERDWRASERASPRVGVGLPPVVVDLRASVGGHERIARRRRHAANAIGRGRLARELRRGGYERDWRSRRGTRKRGDGRREERAE